MANSFKINFPILRLLAICVALVSLLHFHQVTGSEGASQFPVSENSSVDEPLLQINLRCTYDNWWFDEYDCDLYDLDIRTKNIKVASFTGSHLTGKTEEDVAGIRFYNGTMFYLPNGIGNSFKNLKKLIVRRWLGTKLITRSNFLNMENLKYLSVSDNEIEVLPFDTLWDLPSLKDFWLDDNKLKTIDERTFDKNGKLEVVSLTSNRLEFLPRNLFTNNVLLTGVNFIANSIKKIAIDFTLLRHLEYAYLDDNACIDSHYTNFFKGQNIEKITALQGQIRVNCNATN